MTYDLSDIWGEFLPGESAPFTQLVGDNHWTITDGLLVLGDGLVASTRSEWDLTGPGSAVMVRLRFADPSTTTATGRWQVRFRNPAIDVVAECDRGEYRPGGGRTVQVRWRVREGGVWVEGSRAHAIGLYPNPDAYQWVSFGLPAGALGGNPNLSAAVQPFGIEVCDALLAAPGGHPPVPDVRTGIAVDVIADGAGVVVDYVHGFQLHTVANLTDGFDTPRALESADTWPWVDNSAIAYGYAGGSVAGGALRLPGQTGVLARPGRIVWPEGESVVVDLGVAGGVGAALPRFEAATRADTGNAAGVMWPTQAFISVYDDGTGVRRIGSAAIITDPATGATTTVSTASPPVYRPAAHRYVRLRRDGTALVAEAAPVLGGAWALLGPPAILPAGVWAVNAWMFAIVNDSPDPAAVAVIDAVNPDPGDPDDDGSYYYDTTSYLRVRLPDGSWVTAGGTGDDRIAAVRQPDGSWRTWPGDTGDMLVRAPDGGWLVAIDAPDVTG